ncbi:hypothetical protein ACHWQZ_G008720 [Mnemiopsis leidyi]
MFVFVAWFVGLLVPVGAQLHASPPLIVQGPRNKTVCPGTQFKVECMAEGAPAPKITITRLEEAEVEKLESKREVIEEEPCPKEVIYMNEEVSAQDEGWYRCVAANSVGVVFADAFLRVYDLCGDITCTGGRVCVPDNEAATASCVCPECMDISYSPLCGSDCVTHFNYCQLEYKNCLYGTSYTRFLDGSFCPDFTPPEFVETPPREVDVVSGKSFTLTCRAAPAGDRPGPPPIISWYLADYEAPTLDYENPTLYGPDYGQKLGDGETIELRMTENMDIFCVAHQCQDSNQQATAIVSPQITLSLAPAVCFNEWRGGPSCQVFGDPHIITFDNVAYEFEGHCQYILAMECDANKWSVYGSFESCSTHGRGACLKSLTLNYNDKSIELGRGMVVQVDGKYLDIQGLDTITTGSNEILYVFEKDDWLVIKFNFAADKASHYELRWDGMMSAQILLGSDRPKVCGICGNANNDTSDEFTLRRTGIVVAQPARFGDSWRVVHKENDCTKSSDLKWWKWRREFEEQKEDAVATCDKIFQTPQLLTCGQPGNGVARVDPKPYRDACVADMMRSDILPAGLSGVNMACIAASNYAVRCDNMGTVVHLWREQTGCAGSEEDMKQLKKFIRQF